MPMSIEGMQYHIDQATKHMQHLIVEADKRLEPIQSTDDERSEKLAETLRLQSRRLSERILLLSALPELVRQGRELESQFKSAYKDAGEEYYGYSPEDEYGWLRDLIERAENTATHMQDGMGMARNALSEYEGQVDTLCVRNHLKIQSRWGDKKRNILLGNATKGDAKKTIRNWDILNAALPANADNDNWELKLDPIWIGGDDPYYYIEHYHTSASGYIVRLITYKQKRTDESPFIRHVRDINVISSSRKKEWSRGVKDKWMRRKKISEISTRAFNSDLPEKEKQLHSRLERFIVKGRDHLAKLVENTRIRRSLEKAKRKQEIDNYQEQVVVGLLGPEYLED